MEKPPNRPSRRLRERDSAAGRAAKRFEERAPPLPTARCLTKRQAAAYLGIGVTLLTTIGPAPIKVRRRAVYDVVDLDQWLDDYKARGRARKDAIWPVKPESTGEATHLSGGSTLFYRTADAYAKALRLKDGKKQKP